MGGKFLVIQHDKNQSLGTIAEAVKARGLSVQIIRVFEGQTVPRELGGALGLILLSGPMGVGDIGHYQFLREELLLIAQTLKIGAPILGIGLGSQLLAATLGASIKKRREKEFGWFPVKLEKAAKTDPLLRDSDSPFMAFHWHSDVFNLPKGASSLASSELTNCQAYRYGNNAFGFLFHMEITAKIIFDTVKALGKRLGNLQIQENEIIEKTRHYLPMLEEMGFSVFQRWARLTEQKVFEMS